MRVELPECRRCCCCFPLRHGIIVFGYLNLIFSTFVVVMETVVSIKYVKTEHTVALFKGLIFYSQIWFATVLFATDMAFNIVLLVGAHMVRHSDMKRTKLLRVYYYYGITTTLASLVTFIIIRYEELFTHIGYYVLEASFVVSSLGVQVYLLLLVRSELLKLRQRSRLCYVNHATEIVVDTPVEAGRNPF